MVWRGKSHYQLRKVNRCSLHRVTNDIFWPPVGCPGKVIGNCTIVQTAPNPFTTTQDNHIGKLLPATEPDCLRLEILKQIRNLDQGWTSTLVSAMRGTSAQERVRWDVILVAWRFQKLGPKLVHLRSYHVHKAIKPADRKGVSLLTAHHFQKFQRSYFDTTCIGVASSAVTSIKWKVNVLCSLGHGSTGL